MIKVLVCLSIAATLVLYIGPAIGEWFENSFSVWYVVIFGLAYTVYSYFKKNKEQDKSTKKDDKDKKDNDDHAEPKDKTDKSHDDAHGGNTHAKHDDHAHGHESKLNGAAKVWLFLPYLVLICLGVYLLFNHEIIVERLLDKRWASKKENVWSRDIQLAQVNWFDNLFHGRPMFAQVLYKPHITCDKGETIYVQCYGAYEELLGTYTLTYGIETLLPASAYYKVKSATDQSFYIDFTLTEFKGQQASNK